MMNINDTSEILTLVSENMKRENEKEFPSHETLPKSEIRQASSKSTMHHLVHIARPVMTFAVGNHQLKRVNRDIYSPFELLYRLVEHGPYFYPISAIELLELFEETSNTFSADPSLLELDGEITVIGDLRGKYENLHRWLQLTGWPPRNRLLFLGGIIDSDETGSIECLALICCLKNCFPEHVFILRGAPETLQFSTAQRFHPKISEALASCVKRMCAQMPFSAIIGNSILAVYSGVSPLVKGKSNLRNLHRPALPSSLTQLENHLIFNQPSNNVRMYRPHMKSRGDWFGRQAVKLCCKSVGVSMIVRGHSCLRNGYLPCWRHRLINLWSSPGKNSDVGAVLHIAADLKVTPILMKAEY
ncbi:unnamed protein product [Caenorhabditis bovis]|uniref:Serine/threonine specific protein phosphatases domain-containing protein n=1 Tax=Caenorhabditis bovis TaxID=2654633 RepID=A0A8S1EEK6_9PELO|nr:unnamed protein product [Caenorhabditis bovis]